MREKKQRVREQERPRRIQKLRETNFETKICKKERQGERDSEIHRKTEG